MRSVRSACYQERLKRKLIEQGAKRGGTTEDEGTAVADRVYKNGFRAKAGSIGAIAAVTMFGIVAIAFCLLEASFRTWSVGQYFADRAGIFVDLFTAAALCSVMTLMLSCFGRGKSRFVGIAFSVGLFAFVIFIFRANK